MLDKQSDGSFIATVTWLEDNWLYGYILSLGEYVEILEPEHVRDTIREKAQKISKKHS